MGNLPDVVIETGSEDTQDIESDIPTLFKAYISPIDKLRSFSRPSTGSSANQSNNSNIAIVKSDFDNIQVSNVRAMESRAHAFYRMLGLPVVGSDGSFYSPGFDPAAAQTFTKRQAINGKISTSLQTLMGVRETNPDQLRLIFANQDTGSSTYAILLRYPIPFKVLADGDQPLDVDPQFFVVDVRNDVANLLAAANPLLADDINAVVSTVNGARHILRPFIVDPRLENTVMPDSNKICVPFLSTKATTQISPNVFAQRPGIEAIIRQRLSDQTVNATFLTDVNSIISSQNAAGTTTTFNRDTLVTTIEALATDNNVSNATKDLFTGFTDTQIDTVSSLILLIKQVVKQLAHSMMTIDKAGAKINWFPVPSADGPGTGATGASLSRTGTNALSQLDAKILELRILKLNAQSQVVQQADIGTFASPFTGSSLPDNIKTYDDQLQELIQKRDRIAQEAFNAMGNIEMITGEVAGLGLIDVLTIYTALWAIDTESLINFLDDDAFSRLYSSNPSFQGVPEVSARNGGSTKGIIDVLTTFEAKVSNILAFADMILAEQFISPIDATGGSTE